MKKLIILGLSLVVLALPLAVLLTLAQPNWRLSNPLLSPFSINRLPVPIRHHLPPPSLETIFVEDHSWVATLSGEHRWILVTTGDVIPARSVNFKTLQAGDWRWPFIKTAAVLQSADVTFINLETPLLANCPPTNEGMIFCGDARHIEGLKFAGIDVANLANNHTGNWGEVGIDETIKLLNQNDILTTGISGPVFWATHGLKLAFLGYNDIPELVPFLSLATQDKIRSEVAAAKQKADLVIVAFHWGVEYTDKPTERQKALAHLSIDSGADLVIGNHPHWTQPLEIYKSKLIVYAHGNFVFDQMWSQKTREGVIGRYTFYGDRLIDAEFLPVQINDFGQPQFLTGETKSVLLEALKQQSYQWR